MSLIRSYQTICLYILAVILKGINSKPVEVTGENIKYYKLTPNEGSGTYNFDFGTSDGAERSERGYVKHEPGNNNPLLVVTGSFKYPDPKGEIFEVFYIADENGYRIVPKEEVTKVSQKYNEIAPIEQKELPNNQKEQIKKQEEHPKSQQKDHTNNQQEELPKKQELTKEQQQEHTIQEQIIKDQKEEHSKGHEQVTTPIQIFPNEVAIKSKPGESSIIGVKLVKSSPIRKPFECPPGKCSGARQSKVFVIKPIQIS